MEIKLTELTDLTEDEIEFILLYRQADEEKRRIILTLETDEELPFPPETAPDKV